MKNIKQNQAPLDAHKRLRHKPVIAYPLDRLPQYNSDLYESARKQLTLIAETIIPPREAKTFVVPAGHFFRIVCSEGPQVGDLNLWNNDNIKEHFYSGKRGRFTAPMLVPVIVYTQIFLFSGQSQLSLTTH